MLIPVCQIECPDGPIDHMLQEHMKEHGQMVEIIVQKYGHRYKILDGRRRVQALRNLGVTTIAAYVTEKL